MTITPIQMFQSTMAFTIAALLSAALATTYTAQANEVEEVQKVAPSITSDPITEIKSGETYVYEVELEGTPEPTLSALGLPSWLTLDDNVLKGTPERSHAGETGIITLSADNGVAPAAEQEFTIEVVPVPRGFHAWDLPWTAEEVDGYVTLGLRWSHGIYLRYKNADGSWYDNYPHHRIDREVTRATEDDYDFSGQSYSTNKQYRRKNAGSEMTIKVAIEDLSLSAIHGFRMSSTGGLVVAKRGIESLKGLDWTDDQIEIDGQTFAARKASVPGDESDSVATSGVPGDWGMLRLPYGDPDADISLWVMTDKPEETVTIGRTKYICEKWTYVFEGRADPLFFTRKDNPQYARVRSVTHYWFIKDKPGMMAKYEVDWWQGDKLDEKFRETGSELVELLEPPALRRKLKRQAREE